MNEYIYVLTITNTCEYVETPEFIAASLKPEPLIEKMKDYINEGEEVKIDSKQWWDEDGEMKHEFSYQTICAKMEIERVKLIS